MKQSVYVNWIYTGKGLNEAFTELGREVVCIETNIDHIYKNIILIQKTKFENDLRITAVKLLPSLPSPPGPSNDPIHIITSLNQLHFAKRYLTFIGKKKTERKTL